MITDESITERLSPIVTRIAGEVAGELVPLVRDLIREQLTAMLDRIAAAPVESPPPVSRGLKPAKAATPPLTPRGTARRSSARPTGPQCSKCTAAGRDGRGHNARTCGKKPAVGDDEDEGAGAPTENRIAPELGAQPRIAPERSRSQPSEDAVIPHAALVAMLVADRAAAAGGDAGGIVTLGASPSLVGPATTRREVCFVHGWVGRHRFEQDKHELCDPVGPPCTNCDGRKFMQASYEICDRCGATGVESAQPLPVETDDDGGIERDGDVLVQASTLDKGPRTAPRSSTIATKHLTRAVLRAFDDEITAMGPFEMPPRPGTRGECGEERPCPWVSCRHHLYLDVDPETGSIKLNFPNLEPEQLEHSCSLDAADLGAHTLAATAEKMNLVRERVRQIETKALAVLKIAAGAAMPDGTGGTEAA